MPLEIFAVLVPLGILLIVLVVHFSGLSKKARLQDQSQALELLLSDYAGEKPSGMVVLTHNKHSAFIEMAKDNRLGLVEAMGDRFFTRLLRGNDLGAIGQRGNSTLSVEFNDFTHPAGAYEFSDTRDTSRVSAWLSRLKENQ